MKLLHKALDRRYRVSINQFAEAKTAEEVRALWQEEVQRREGPGAYWAALTHSATNDLLQREVFAEVHMLSHLVGAANRAEIRRLRQLEAEKTELEGKVGRQQQQLRDAVVSRDAMIRQLRRALEERIVRNRNGDAEHFPEADSRMLLDLTADLKQRLATTESRCERLERQLEACRSDLPAPRSRSKTRSCDRSLRRQRQVSQKLRETAARTRSHPACRT
jgi:hypothetical protein